MLRWINEHKLITLGFIVGSALIGGSLLTRAGSEEGSAESTAPPATGPAPTPVSSSVASSGPAPASTSAAAPSSSTSSSTVPEGTGALSGASAEQLSMPTDPSGARQRRSEDGARQAAIDYLTTVRQRLLYLKPDAGREVLDAWRAPGVAGSEVETMVDQLEELRSMLAAAGGDVWWAVSPLAVRVEAYAPDRARVSVWTVNVMASGGSRDSAADVVVPVASYSTPTVELLWSGSGWSVWSVTSESGPVPMMDGESKISAPEEFIRALDGFSLIKEHR